MNSRLIPTCAGVILAGGKSSRFGANKALVPFKGKPLIKHVSDTLTPLFSTCLIVTNTPAEYGFLGLPLINDLWLAKGPLAGIHAGLRHIEEPYALITACDLPFIHTAVVSLLCRLAQGHDAVVPALGRGLEPLLAVYHKNCLPVIEEQLDRDERRVNRIFARLRTRLVTAPEILAVAPDLASFHNINRPEDLPLDRW